MRDGKGIHTAHSDVYSDRQPDNDYLMDRGGQRAGKTYSASRASPCRMRRCRKHGAGDDRSKDI